MLDGVADTRFTGTRSSHQHTHQRGFMLHIIYIGEACAPQVGCQRRKYRMRHGSPIDLWRLRGQEFDEFGQLLRHLRRSILTLSVTITAVFLLRHLQGSLHYFGHRHRLLALACRTDGGHPPTLFFAVIGQKGCYPRWVVVAQVTQVARHGEDERITRPVFRASAQLVFQCLDNRRIRHALIHDGVRCRLVLGRLLT